METEDRLATMEKRLHNQEKRLRYHQVVGGVMALCLILAVATHVGAQRRGRSASQPLPTNQLASASGELTCTKLTVVNSAGQPMVELGAGIGVPGGQAKIYGPDGTIRIWLAVSPQDGGGFAQLYRSSGQAPGVSLNARNTGGKVDVFDATTGNMTDVQEGLRLHETHLNVPCCSQAFGF